LEIIINKRLLDAALFQYAKEQVYIPLGYPLEIYLNNLTKVEESELIT